MSVAAALVSSARRNRAISGRSLARKTGSSQAGLVSLERGTSDATAARLERVLRALNYQLTALPTRLGTAATAAEAVRAYVAEARQDAAFRIVLQLAADLDAADPALRVALCVAPPAPTGDVRFDALLAAVVDYRLSADRLPLPHWISEGSRVLDEAWDIEPVQALQAAARLQTPDALRRHGVFLDPAELVNA